MNQPTAVSMVWHGSGSELNVAGFRLKDPGVYITTCELANEYDATDPSELWTSAPVQRPSGSVPDMGYWPWYSRLLPEHRFLYLDWLSRGRRTLPPMEGLLFLYYYGLERRLLIDEQDKPWVLREIMRLRALDAPRRGTKEGRSFRNYSTGLLWFEVARSPELFNTRAISQIIAETERWSESALQSAVSWCVRRGHRLDWKLAFQLAHVDPRSVNSVVTTRLSAQFSELFSKRYREQFGDGLELRASKRARRHAYRPASGGLREATVTIPDPMAMPSQFAPLVDLWNGCIDDLRRLSRVPASSVVTTEAWEAMPAELREGLDYPLADSIRELVSSAPLPATGGDGRFRLLNAGLFAELTGVSARSRLTLAQSRRIADVLDYAGFDVEPDARVMSLPYGWQDCVAVYTRQSEEELDGALYRCAASLMHLGMTVAEADGTVDPAELHSLGEQIDAVLDLQARARDRLEALESVLLRSGAAFDSVAKRIENTVPTELRQTVGRLLVAIAAASNGIDRSELVVLRKCFRVLQLPPELLDSTCAELAPTSQSDLVSMRAISPTGSGETISAASSLTLNRAAISAILAETREVASMLANAMATDDPPTTVAIESEPVQTEPARPGPNTPPIGLPARHRALLDSLSVRARWDKPDVEQLARAHGLMLGGALEVINEWAWEQYGLPAIEETEFGISVVQLPSIH